MTKELFKYLSDIDMTDTNKVNSLFVSVFLDMNGINTSHNKTLLNIIADDEELKGAVDVSKAIISKHTRLFNLEDLMNVFEFVISPSNRIVHGAVYTPKYIRNAIITHCFEDYNNEQLSRVRIADISCGCGGFLLDAAIYIHNRIGKKYIDIFRENIFGIDIQSYSIERTKLILTLLALINGEDGLFSFNLLKADSLDYRQENWNQSFTNFDVILGNPPYVCSKKVSKETRHKMRNFDVCSTGHPDLYIPFFQIAIDLLSDNGILGYITMNSFLRSINGRALRDYLSRGQYNIEIIDFRGLQIFKSKSTYTCLFYLFKGKRQGKISYSVNDSADLAKPTSAFEIEYRYLDNLQGWSLNSYKETQLFESNGIPIKEYCDSRHGIATLSNATYIFKPVDEDDLYYVLNNKGKAYRIEKAICRNIINPNKLNSMSAFDSIIEKVIYPYAVNDSGRAQIIDSTILRDQYPYTYKYLESQKKILKERDKGNTDDYPAWYAYGRTQSLVTPRNILFVPKLANKPLNCVLCEDTDLLIYNGIAFVSDESEKLKVIKRVIESAAFWRYVVANSKPYSSNYYAVSGVNINNFCIPRFTVEEKMYLLGLDSRDEIDRFLKRFYSKD